MKYRQIEPKFIEREFDVLPCPFCGCDNLTIKHIDGSWGYSNSKDYVECNCCKARGGYVEDSQCGKNFEKAIKNWNMREN